MRVVVDVLIFFFSSRRRHTRCALVTGVQTCALPICDKIPLGVTGRAPGARSADEEGGISNGDARLLARVEAGYKMQDGTVDKGAIAEHQIGRASCRARVCQYV